MTSTAPAGSDGARPRVVVVGGGFAGFHAARRLERLLPPEAAELTVVSPNDHLLYSPLLPDVAAGAVDPRHIAVSLHDTLHRTTVELGFAVAVDLDARTVSVRSAAGDIRPLPWDRLVLSPGSVTRPLPIPGLDEHARGFKSLNEALYLRDHVLQQLELADASDDPAERARRCTVVVVGAGYAGSEFLARMQRMVALALPRLRRVGPADMRWLLVDAAPAVLPELGPALGRRALQMLRARGVDVRLSTTVEEIRADRATLSDGDVIPTRTLVWTAGVTPSPLIAHLAEDAHLEVEKGRLVVDAHMAVPGRDDVWALGDAAAVPDLTKPGKVTPPTAQHAQRQGTAVARNVAASLGHGRARAYRHHDLGLVVDLGGRDAVARPLGVPLSGLPAKLVTRGYHLMALPAAANRIRVGLDWLLQLGLRTPVTQLGFIPEDLAPLPAAEHTDIYDAFRGTAGSAGDPHQHAG